MSSSCGFLVQDHMRRIVCSRSEWEIISYRLNVNMRTRSRKTFFLKDDSKKREGIVQGVVVSLFAFLSTFSNVGRSVGRSVGWFVCGYVCGHADRACHAFCRARWKDQSCTDIHIILIGFAHTLFVKVGMLGLLYIVLFLTCSGSHCKLYTSTPFYITCKSVEQCFGDWISTFVKKVRRPPEILQITNQYSLVSSKNMQQLTSISGVMIRGMSRLSKSGRPFFNAHVHQCLMAN